MNYTLSEVFKLGLLKTRQGTPYKELRSLKLLVKKYNIKPKKVGKFVFYQLTEKEITNLQKKIWNKPTKKLVSVVENSKNSSIGLTVSKEIQPMKPNVKTVVK